MPTQPKLPDPYDEKNLVAALLVLAQSNFDLVAAATKEPSVNAREKHDKMLSELGR